MGDIGNEWGQTQGKNMNGTWWLINQGAPWLLLMGDMGSWGDPLGAIQTDDFYKEFN